MLNIPPTIEVSQDFSLILVELYASHWERIKQYSPSLQIMLRFIREVQSLCTKVGTLINSSMLVIGPKLIMAQDLILMLYVAQDEELREKGIADHRQFIRKTNVFINQHRVIMHMSAVLEPLQIQSQTSSNT